MAPKLTINFLVWQASDGFMCCANDQLFFPSYCFKKRLPGRCARYGGLTQNTDTSFLVTMNKVDAVGPRSDGSAAATHRKHLGLMSGASCQVTVVYSAASDDSSADNSFIRALSSKAKQKLRKIENSSSSNTSTIPTERGSSAHTVLFVLQANTNNLNRINRQATSVFVEDRVPRASKDVKLTC
ncbi:hypothetical protein V5799_013744 [Amblyomma americanum]|uniref:Uncharacterized protein n=1 Tax=Amblyomma americanum TaxID=6943 RepID=A0AAQ4E515_AMBAM